MIIRKIKLILSDRFVRNIGWLGIAEFVNRIFRLGTTITLANTFSKYDYGVVSIIYTIFDFGNVFTIRSGIGAKIIQADEQELEDLCNSAYWLNWILCGSLFIIQCSVAYPIALFYQNSQLNLLICAVALAYLIIPNYMVQATLIQRENRLKITALSSALQGIFSNIMLVIFALLGWGAWAIVWAMVLSYLVCVVIFYLNHPWRPSKFFQLVRWRELLSYGIKLLGVDVLGRLRMYLDYLLIGPFLGIEALGLYFFAFNAGLGISQSVINAFTSALFPHLCEVRTDKEKLKSQFFRSLKTIGLIVVPLVMIQSCLAPFYIPIISRQKWVEEAIPIIILICLSAIPMSLSRATSQLLQAVDQAHIDLYWNVFFTEIFASCLLLAVQKNIFWVAVAVLTSQAISMPIFTFWAIRYVFPKKLDETEGLENSS